MSSSFPGVCELDVCSEKILVFRLNQCICFRALGCLQQARLASVVIRRSFTHTCLCVFFCATHFTCVRLCISTGVFEFVSRVSERTRADLVH